MTGVQTCALPICFPVTIALEDSDPLKARKQDADEQNKGGTKKSREAAQARRAVRALTTAKVTAPLKKTKLKVNVQNLKDDRRAAKTKMERDRLDHIRRAGPVIRARPPTDAMYRLRCISYVLRHQLRSVLKPHTIRRLREELDEARQARDDRGRPASFRAILDLEKRFVMMGYCPIEWYDDQRAPIIHRPRIKNLGYAKMMAFSYHVRRYLDAVKALGIKRGNRRHVASLEQNHSLKHLSAVYCSLDPGFFDLPSGEALYQCLQALHDKACEIAENMDKDRVFDAAVTKEKRMRNTTRIRADARRKKLMGGVLPEDLVDPEFVSQLNGLREKGKVRGLQEARRRKSQLSGSHGEWTNEDDVVIYQTTEGWWEHLRDCKRHVGCIQVKPAGVALRDVIHLRSSGLITVRWVSNAEHYAELTKCRGSDGIYRGPSIIMQSHFCKRVPTTGDDVLNAEGLELNPGPLCPICCDEMGDGKVALHVTGPGVSGIS